MNNLELWIGLRYLKSKKKIGFISFISAISIIGIALGVTALIVVLSVMNGFQKEVRAKLFQVAPHIEAGYYDFEKNSHYQSLERLFLNNKNVISTMPFISNQVLLANSGEIKGTEIYGVLPEKYKNIVDNKFIKNSIYLKQLKSPNQFNIILGNDLASSLDLKIGEKVTVITPEGNISPAGFVPRLKQFTLVGTIKTDVYELNNTIALINLNIAQKLFGLGDKVSGVRVKLKHPDKAPELTPSILPKDNYKEVWVQDWSHRNKSYFEAVALEKKMMFIIMVLISAVASFNLVSSLVMTVNEKKADIAILRTLGLSPANIMKIFMIQGSVAGFVGTFLGVIIGILIAANITSIVNAIEFVSGKKFVNSEIYFLDYIPTDIQMSDVTTITIISLILVLLATIYPSLKAAHTKPAEALRYE